MKPTARTILTHSLLVPMALAVAAALAACAGESVSGGNGVTASGTAGASTGSTGASAATGAGAGPAAPAGQASGGGTAANVPAAAKTLICPPPVPVSGQLNAPGAAPQVVPAGFSPVAVVQCRAAGAIEPLAGQLTYVRKEVAVADLRPLLASLQEPSAPRAGPGPTPGCPVLTTPVPELALIGRDGSVVYPRIPVTVCGAAIAPVTASLAALHWIMLSATSPQQAGQPQAGRPQGGQPQGARTPPIVVQPAN
ncbi:MAG TPA: hypothetical protein VK836_23970 [Streptosporangiaceae bacterium]|nr:hypothetical protein [Streptosporangiaceae bacterium]